MINHNELGAVSLHVFLKKSHAMIQGDRVIADRTLKLRPPERFIGIVGDQRKGAGSEAESRAGEGSG